MLGSSRNWLTTGAELARRYHVFALDLRNHGRSPHADSMTYPELVDDVLAWMTAHEVPRATLLGHSMGGKTAMLLACRHAARVEELIVVDIAPKDYSWVAHRTNFAAMNELNLADLRSRADAELRLEARVRDWGMRKFLTTNLEQDSAGAWRWTINLPALTTAIPVLEANPLTAGDRFDGPTRFFRGSTSDYVQIEDESDIRRHFPRATIETIEDSGHNPHMDQREAFVRAVLGGG
jgi:pimeloyl-ACP methyl ester carboxylesterase